MSSPLTLLSTRDVTCLGIGAIIGGGLAILYAYDKNNNDEDNKNKTKSIATPPSELPTFANVLASNPMLHRIRLREWEDVAWRKRSGWHGRDLCHNPEGQAVRVLEYYYDSDRMELTGVVWFGPDAESHRGLCHGGAMTSLMDDVAGHAAFVASTSPWSGATVQVNVSLKKPVPVGSVLRIVGRVSKRERRKVHIDATLDDGNIDTPVVYAILEGLSIDGVKMSDHDDDIAIRKWEDDKCDAGRPRRRDSGWNLT